MKKEWFVLRTLTGQEKNVRENIEKRKIPEDMEESIGDVLVPEENVAEIRAGKKKVTKRKLYPGYVFVEMELLDEDRRINDGPWHFIQETPGIIGFIGGDNPLPTSEEEVELIRSRIADSAERERPKIKFEIGDTVKINDGPFLNLSGEIEEIDKERGKIRVVVSIFGRNTPVDLEYWQIDKG